VLVDPFAHVTGPRNHKFKECSLP